MLLLLRATNTKSQLTKATGRSVPESSAGCLSLDRLSRVSWSLDGVAPEGRSTMADDKACWCSNRLSEFRRSTGAIIAVVVSGSGVLVFALGLEIAMLSDKLNNCGW